MKDADDALSAHPSLQKLCIEVLRDEDTNAGCQLIEIGLAISDVLFYGACSSERIRKWLGTCEQMPMRLMAIRDFSYAQIDYIYDEVGFGRDLDFRASHTKGGPKRFQSSSPSSVALSLYFAMQEFVIPESEPEKREAKRLQIRHAIDTLDKNASDYHHLFAGFEFVKKLVALPKLSKTSYHPWAEIGAQLLVDFSEDFRKEEVASGKRLRLPLIPDAWKANAEKRKEKGALRTYVYKKLVVGFESIAR